MNGARGFGPVTSAHTARQRVLAVLGVALGLAVAGLGSWLAAPAGAQPWLVASLGASAVLVFALPQSPLAQPWPVVVGNTLSCLAGVLVVNLGHAVPGLPTWCLPALAGALAAAFMFAARALHAPGGGCAIVPVLAGVDDFAFVLNPMLLDSVLLVAVGLCFHRLTGQRYPHR